MRRDFQTSSERNTERFRFNAHSVVAHPVLSDRSPKATYGTPRIFLRNPSHFLLPGLAAHIFLLWGGTGARVLHVRISVSCWCVFPEIVSCVSAVYPRDCGSHNCTQGTKILGCRNFPHPTPNPLCISHLVSCKGLYNTSPDVLDSTSGHCYMLHKCTPSLQVSAVHPTAKARYQHQTARGNFGPNLKNEIPPPPPTFSPAEIYWVCPEQRSWGCGLVYILLPVALHKWGGGNVRMLGNTVHGGTW